jgi:hypothetical protein
MIHENLWRDLSSKVALLSEYPMLPAEFEGDISSVPYVKIAIVTSPVTNNDYSGGGKVHGVIQFSVFYLNSNGPLSGLGVVSYLEENLNNQQINRLQTFMGGSQPMGLDPSNRSLARRDFSLPFLYHGE